GAPSSEARVSYATGPMSNRGTPQLSTPRVRTLRAPIAKTSPGFAAVLSGLFPGLGQMYGGRWVRGILMILVPIFVVLLSGAFIAIADPLTTLVLRNAPGFTFLVAGLFFIYHVYVVTDAFAGRLTGLGAFGGRRALGYVVLGLVCVFLATFYAAAYRGSAPWAGLAAQRPAPIAKAPLLGNPRRPTPPPARAGP